MIVNISNHPSDTWDDQQKEAICKYGKILDIPFPAVSAYLNETETEKLANDYLEKIKGLEPDMVMVQGEYTFTYRLVKKLKELGIKCIAACSDRMTSIKVNPDGSSKKTSIYKFVRFREY